ncbi:ataxia telangiectasia mutated family protein [Tanacetum coccineum]
MYEGPRIFVRNPTGNTEYFPVDVGLHQGSAISSYLFALILDELTRGIQKSITWCLIFADDIVLVSKTPEGLNERLEQNKNDRNEKADIHISGHREAFRYLGSVIKKSERIDDDATHRIQAGWLKWRAATGIQVLAVNEGSSKYDGCRINEDAKVDLWRVESIIVDGARKRGRPKLRWEDRLKIDLKELVLSEDMTSDRNSWRTRIRVDDEGS